MSVTLKTCNTRMGLVATASVVLLILVGWAIAAGRMAQSDAADVKGEFQTHAAAQEVRDKHVAETLNEIKVTVRAFDGKLNSALRERHDGGGD